MGFLALPMPQALQHWLWSGFWRLAKSMSYFKEYPLR